MKTACNFIIQVLTLILITVSFSPTDAKVAVDPKLIKDINFRMIGPYRGGRVSTVTGVPNDSLTYYMGASGGGLWKTSNAGTTWENISDDYFNVGTIGAVAVAPSNINVLYVGTGESPIRGVTTSHGDGVY